MMNSSQSQAQPIRPITIFDTTLRDGEQSPGASMNLAEKLEVAHALSDLGVDVMEAGFPIASPGDFEAVREIATTIRGPIICGLARCNDGDIDRAWEALQKAKQAPLTLRETRRCGFTAHGLLVSMLRQQKKPVPQS